MVKIIAIASGKGGVGKTTIATNLGLALQMMGRRTIVVDTNLTTSHLGLCLGHYDGKTLNHFLRNQAKIEETIHTHHSGLQIIPASLELGDLSNIETDNLGNTLKSIFANYDFVFLDSAPGIGREALISLRACDETIFVANPSLPSVVDIIKTKDLQEKLQFKPAGIVLNRVRNKKYEIKPEEVMRITDMPVISVIREDSKFLKSTNSCDLVVAKKPKSRPSKSIFSLAHYLSFQYHQMGRSAW